MRLSPVIKITVFWLMLIGVHVLLGLACNKVQADYSNLFPPGRASLNLALWVVGSILLAIMIAGLVVALVRPLWVIALGFLLSSLAMFVAWGINIYSGIATQISGG
jgi:hypothetical protein